MSYFHSPDAGSQAEEEPRERKRQTVAELGGRVARWFAGYDDEPDDQATAEYDPMAMLDPEYEDGPESEELLAPAQPRSRAPAQPRSRAPEAPEAPDEPWAASDEESSRFPLAPFGYNRLTVDEHLGRIERELDELRSREQPPMSINEELERIGEQTASILVVAHDTAHETTRLAQEQADRCIADAASNAVAITDEATRRLRELDEETDQVWRERARLLEDVRDVSASLASLADQADERFPAESKAPVTEDRTQGQAQAQAQAPTPTG